jgi:hypothetical protein
VLQACLAALPAPLQRGAILKFEPGAQAPHPVTACAHMIDRATGGGRGRDSRTDVTAPRRRFLTAPAAAVSDRGGLRWGASLGDAYTAINSTEFDDQGVGHKAVFYDGRVVTLMDGPGAVNAVVYSAFLRLNASLVTRRCVVCV